MDGKTIQENNDVLCHVENRLVSVMMKHEHRQRVSVAFIHCFIHLAEACCMEEKGPALNSSTFWEISLFAFSEKDEKIDIEKDEKIDITLMSVK